MLFQNNAASMILARFGPAEAIPLYEECRKLAVHLYGEESYQVAHIEFLYATTYSALPDGLKLAYTHAKDSHRLFVVTLGEKSADTEEAGNFVSILEEVFARESAEKQANAERLKNALPAIMGKKVNGTLKSESLKVEDVVPQKPHGQKADLSLDELVNFIQGTPASKGKASGLTKKRKQSPAGKSAAII